MAIVMRSGEIRRYNENERLNHWAVAILFVLLAASGSHSSTRRSGF